MQNSFLFFNIISFDLYTLRQTLFQFFYPLRKVRSFKACKILMHSGDNLIRQKSLSPSQMLRFRNKKKSEGAKSGE